MSSRRQTLATLTLEYRAWNRANNLDLASADEHVNDASLTEPQRAWLRDFVERWDKAEATALGAFVDGITTENTGGGCMVDFVELQDGRCLGINEDVVCLYPSRACFDSAMLNYQELPQIDLTQDGCDAIAAQLWNERDDYPFLHEHEFTSHEKLLAQIKHEMSPGCRSFQSLAAARQWFRDLNDEMSKPRY
jgi:hypothetical protein